MSIDKSYVNDYLTKVRTYLYTDLTSVSGLTYYWLKPLSGTTGYERVTKDNVQVESYVSGVVYYETDENDFDYPGEYKSQVLVTFQNGGRYRSHTRSFQVYGEFE